MGFGEIGVLWVLGYRTPAQSSTTSSPAAAVVAAARPICHLSLSRSRRLWLLGYRFLGLGWREEDEQGGRRGSRVSGVSRELGEGKGGVRVSGFRVERGR